MRIALYFDYVDPVFYYRMQPWQYLARQAGFEIHNVNARDRKAFEGIIASYDVLIISRPHTSAHYDAIKAARLNGVQVIADYDDNIFDIPKDNPVWVETKREDYHKTALSCLKFAHYRIASTQTLLDALYQYEPLIPHKTRVIPNAVNDFALPPVKKVAWTNDRLNEPIHYIWRGGNTHAADLVGLHERIGNWTFIGYNPVFLNWKYEFIPFNGLYEYYATLNKISAPSSLNSVMIYPMGNTSFNRCKSEGVVLEAAWAGMPIIAPKDLPQFMDIPGVIDIAESYDIEKLFESTIKTQTWVIENRMLSNVNLKRAELLKEVIA